MKARIAIALAVALAAHGALAQQPAKPATPKHRPAHAVAKKDTSSTARTAVTAPRMHADTGHVAKSKTTGASHKKRRAAKHTMAKSPADSGAAVKKP
jgi:hypothetical protein